MAFADISYFGDRADSGGSPAWSGRVTSTSELDRFDWGGGRKSPFSSVMSGKNGGDMDRLIENALKKRERKAKLTEAMEGGSLLKDFNKKDNAVGGASVGVTGGQDMRPNDLNFDVRGSTVNAQFPFASRIGYDPKTDELSQFVRVQKFSGMGRVVGIESEQRIPITKLSRPGFFFSLEWDKNKECLMIKNCRVFLGCLHSFAECEDVAVKKGYTGFFYIRVDFSDQSRSPVLTVEEAADKDETEEPEENIFKFPLFEFEDGICIRGGINYLLLPTYTFFYVEKDYE